MCAHTHTNTPATINTKDNKATVNIWCLCFSPTCLFLLLLPVLLESYSRNHYKASVMKVFLYFFRSFTLSGLIYKPLIHFELISVHGVRKESNFILSHVDIQFSQHHLLTRLSFPHFVFLEHLSKISWLYMCGFISGLSILFQVFMSAIMLVPYCFNYCSFITLKSESVMPPGLFFPFKAVLAIQSPLWFHTNFRIFVCSFL